VACPTISRPRGSAAASSLAARSHEGRPARPRRRAGEISYTYTE
jgi:hypothetical protein